MYFGKNVLIFSEGNSSIPWFIGHGGYGVGGMYRLWLPLTVMVVDGCCW
jgi:hypothetical protein